METYLLWLQLACCQASLSVLNMPTEYPSLPLLLIHHEYTFTNRKHWYPFFVNIPWETLKREDFTLTFHIFLNFTNVLLTCNFIPLLLENILFIISVLKISVWKFIETCFVAKHDLSWIMVHVHLRRMCIFLSGMFYRCLLGQVDL